MFSDGFRRFLSSHANALLGRSRSPVFLGVVALGAFGAATLRAVERLPIEDFARPPDMSRARLSPNGKSVAFLREQGGRTIIFISSLDEAKGARIDPGTAPFANDAPKEVEGFVWVNDQRLLISTAVWQSRYGVLATDTNARNTVGISGYEMIPPGSIHAPPTFIRDVLARGFTSEPVLLMVDRHDVMGGNPENPDIVKVDTSTGSMTVVAKNPGKVVSWSADNHGVVRLGVMARDKLSGIIYREKADDPWKELLPMQERLARFRSLGYDAATGKFLVVTLDETRHWVPCRLDPETKELGEPLLTDNDYDIFAPRVDPRVDNIPLNAPIYGPGDQGLLGFRYFTDAPRVKWLVKEFADYQRKIDRGLPNTVNIPVEISQDGKRILWFAYSDQDPGTYLLTDLEHRTLKPVGKRMGWIKPAQMAQMLSLKYTARDGVVIHGYLTAPVGHEAKNLPLIVMPHGGPWVRDVWEFDPLVQLLANRGYAVLQMNYRGSPGYGQELFEKAQREIGGKIQDDIEDAARWAITTGIADPKRVAIFGGSYGGYSALFGLGKNPDLYRCGISFAGVTDWLDIFQRRRNDPDYKRANEFWREQIGDPDKDAERLRAASPVNFADKIVAPVLIIQGKEDRIVPPQQANLMIAALEKSGRKPERLFVSKTGHNFGDEKARNLIFKRIVDFLETNLGQGVQ